MFICQILRSNGTNIANFAPNLTLSKLYLQFEFINGYEMMHKVEVS